MRLTLIITTYERPDALGAVLATVARQTEPPDEIVIADDGSSARTHEVIAGFAERAASPVRAVTQQHCGFRVARLRNLAIARARGERIVLVDGDMLLDPRFIADHRRHARAGAWTQGVRIRLDAHATARALATPGELPSIGDRGIGGLRRLYALHAPRLAPLVTRPANAFIAVKACNQGHWRRDLLAVNGFNEDIEGWGAEDKELAVRLANLGVARRTLLFGGIAWHLAHAAAARDRRAANDAVLARTRALGLTRCERGLDAHL